MGLVVAEGQVLGGEVEHNGAASHTVVATRNSLVFCGVIRAGFTGDGEREANFGAGLTIITADTLWTYLA